MSVTSVNFGFLAAHSDLLVRYAGQAERYVADDPNTALIKLRQFGEVLACQTAAYVGAYTSRDAAFSEVLHALRDRGALDATQWELFRSLRRAGNAAAHEHANAHRDAVHQLRTAHRLAVAFHQAYGNAPDFQCAFVPPRPPRDASAELQAELDRLRDELAAHEAQAAQATSTAEEHARHRRAAEARAAEAYGELEAAMELAQETAEQLAAERAAFDALLDEAQAASERAPEQVADRLRAAKRVSARLELTEAETRALIDAQLADRGWEADTVRLRHARGARPEAGRNLAIAEWPTASGPADYVLFVGLTPVAIVEAKRRTKDVSAALVQAARYSRDLHLDDTLVPAGGPWDGHKVPFLFATNGRPYLRQLRTASGVWFRDTRRRTNHGRDLDGWYTPEGLQRRLKRDMDDAAARLAADPPSYLPLRDYQRDAIAAVEQAIVSGRRDILLAMATGTGKTRTAICLIYRLLKAGRFHRVLFLVDRTSLGEQAHDAFQNVKLEQQHSFDDIYDVKGLGDVTPEGDTRLHLATVQGMVKRVLYASDDAPPVPVDAYDCVVVDECHRGYHLDRELSDAELTFRSEADYISKYRRILDHFDAVRIGLTATPALHTTQIFGDPVYRYSYRQAVVDGHLIDHEPPIRPVTELAEEGIRWSVGDPIEVYSLRDQQIDLFHTPDDVEIDIDGFNRRVVTESFNRTVCTELANHIDPSLPGKTLVFCATDAHADLVVMLLKEELAELHGALDDDAVVKITGSAGKPGQLIRNFKNEPNPRIAVTVDLLTTGIDVPAITNLVFLRRVRSRILYEQMLGRATRRCDAIHKEVFRIFDAVDLYSALLPVSSMKPVVADPRVTFSQLVAELGQVPDPKVRANLLDQLVAKLRRVARGFSDVARDAFAARAGASPEDVAHALGAGGSDAAVRWFDAHEGLPAWLDRDVPRDGAGIYISHHPDKLRRVERGYGQGQRPEDYLESFGAYVREHLNDIPALVVVTQRPRDLTRADLKALKLALDQAGYTEAGLRVAWRETTNQEIAASIVGFIRQKALGAPLEPYADRVRRAVAQVASSRPWTTPQRQWLERIGDQLIKEIVVDRDALDIGVFASHGGYERLNKRFRGELDAVLGELAEAVWEDAG